MNWVRRLLNTGYLGVLARVEREIPFWPLGRVEWIQRRRLRSTIQHAYESVPFYRRVMNERGLAPDDFQTAADLAKLPFIGDADLQRSPEEFVSTRIEECARYAVYTSGTQSGRRTVIYWDEAASLRQLAYHERDRVVYNRLAGQGWGQRQLYILPPTSSSLETRAFWDARTLTPHSLAQRHVVSSNLRFDEVISQINAVRPVVVFSYGSYAEQFARYVDGCGLAVAGPKVWMYGGDMLSPAGRQLLEERLGCTVYSTYQTAESGRLGFQCERCQGFHLNVDLCAVRLVDDGGRAVPPGERGEVVVSNLHNRAMVLLNYRLGDLAVLSPEPCACGRSLPVLGRLEGKRSEAIFLPGGRSLSVYQVENACAEERKSTLAAQLVQPAPDRLIWRVVAAPGVDLEALRGRFVETTTRFVGGSFRVAVEFVQEIPSTPQGKLRRVIPWRPDRKA